MKRKKRTPLTRILFILALLCERIKLPRYHIIKIKSRDFLFSIMFSICTCFCSLKTLQLKGKWQQRYLSSHLKETNTIQGVSKKLNKFVNKFEIAVNVAKRLKVLSL